MKQDFSFAVKEVSGKVLRISVFDASLQKQHEAIGHALLTLEDIASDQPKKYRIKLYRRTQVCWVSDYTRFQLLLRISFDKFIPISASYLSWQFGFDTQVFQ